MSENKPKSFTISNHSSYEDREDYGNKNYNNSTSHDGRKYNNQNQGSKNWNNSQSDGRGFMNGFGEGKTLEQILSFETFKQQEQELKKISSASSLRNVYDSYMDIIHNKGSEIDIKIWIAKISYQEARKVLPQGFAQFTNDMYKKLGKENFTKFMEVFVAYHKFFNPKAN